MVVNSPVSHIHFHNLKQTGWKTARQEKWRVRCWLSTPPFSFPEVVLLLVRTKNHDLWLDPIFWACTECSCILYSQSIRFIRLDRKFVNRWLTVLEQCRDCDSWCGDSGDKNSTLQEQIIHKVFLFTSSNQQCSSRKYPYLPLWKFWLSFIHFGLTKTPIPRKFQSLRWVKYGYFLELKVYMTDFLICLIKSPQYTGKYRKKYI